MSQAPLPALGSESSLEDFYRFFKRVPAQDWCVDQFKNGRGQCCARGLVGKRTMSEKVEADDRLLSLAPQIVEVNNDEDNEDYSFEVRSRGIKSRVLRYLKQIIDRNRERPSK